VLEPIVLPWLLVPPDWVEPLRLLEELESLVPVPARLLVNCPRAFRPSVPPLVWLLPPWLLWFAAIDCLLDQAFRAKATGPGVEAI
jgi:hypothetical protein